MNPEPHILDVSPEPSTSESPTPVSDFSHRGNGKISHLPKALRDQINNWILDGITYPKIIERLGEQGQHLKPGHFCEYRKRGYEDWLCQREWFDHVVSKSEFSKDLLTAPDSSSLHEAGLRMAAAQMLDQLMRFGAAVQTDGSDPQPEKFARLVNALSRLTREALAFEKYHDACANARAALQELKDPKRKLTEDETRAIVLKVEKILGLGSADTTEKVEPPSSAPSNPESCPILSHQSY
jgi:hypothetical protein